MYRSRPQRFRKLPQYATRNPSRKFRHTTLKPLVLLAQDRRRPENGTVKRFTHRPLDRRQHIVPERVPRVNPVRIAPVLPVDNSKPHGLRIDVRPPDPEQRTENCQPTHTGNTPHAGEAGRPRPPQKMMEARLDLIIRMVRKNNPAAPPPHRTLGKKHMTQFPRRELQ
jgi:hypothetical protein